MAEGSVSMLSNTINLDSKNVNASLKNTRQDLLLKSRCIMVHKFLVKGDLPNVNGG